MTAATIPVFDAARENAGLREALAAAAARVIDSGRYILGDEVDAFEQEVAKLLGAGHAIAVASGTDALRLALTALEVAPGDRVITTAFTFFATAGAIVGLGATPVLLDVDPATANLDPQAVARELRRNPGTKAIVPVHLYGRAADMHAFAQLSAESGVPVLEDAAQAMGATVGSTMVGTLGDAGALSFFPTKNLGGFGDGGMIVTGRDDVAERVRLLRVHGASRKYRHDIVGTNSRLDALQAAMLRLKLPHLGDALARRTAIAALYQTLLEDVPGMHLPSRAGDGEHTYNLFVVRIPDRRDAVQHQLLSQGIQTAIHYPCGLHEQPALEGLVEVPERLSSTEMLSQQVLAIPMFPAMLDDEVRAVAAALRVALA